MLKELPSNVRFRVAQMSGIFMKAPGLQKCLDQLHDDDIAFILDVDIEFDYHLLDNIRTYIVKSQTFFAPIGFLSILFPAFRSKPLDWDTKCSELWKCGRKGTPISRQPSRLCNDGNWDSWGVMFPFSFFLFFSSSKFWSKKLSYVSDIRKSGGYNTELFGPRHGITQIQTYKQTQPNQN